MAIRGFASLDELVAVQNRLVEMYGWSAPHAKQHLDEYISQFGSNPEWLFVAEEAGAVQGALLASDRGRDGSLSISSFGVFPEYQRKDVGTALLAEAERRARQQGKVRLLLGAADDSEPFYLKCGFTPRLYVDITGEESAATLQSLLAERLAAYNVLWSDQGEQLSKAILDVPGLMPELRAVAGAGRARLSYPASLHERVLNGSALASAILPHYAPDRGCRPAGHQPT